MRAELVPGENGDILFRPQTGGFLQQVQRRAVNRAAEGTHR